MKIKITTENRLGVTNEILQLVSDQKIDVLKVEVVTGFMFLETEAIEKLVQRQLVTQIMQIKGVKWVEDINILPAYERTLFLTSLLNAMSEPVIGINNKGEIIYYNDKAQSCFSLSKTIARTNSQTSKSNLKNIFSSKDWASKIDVAATNFLPVNINTISGNMLVEVQAIKQVDNIGAVLIFHQPEHILTRSHIINDTGAKNFNALVVKNPKMQDVIARAKQMSNNQSPMIIYGESGVGKQSIAQIIHHNSHGKHHLFVTLNCAVESQSSIENELFGTANPKTGKAGLLEIANKGTLYIKAIHEMPEACQLKLLQFFNKNEFSRIGGMKIRKSELKIIVSSNEPLKELVEKKLFNQELYYVLDIANLNIPPLRERTDEIEDLVDLFIDDFSQKTGKNISQISLDSLNKIKTYFWPGNIKQLKETLYKTCMLSDTHIIHSKNIEIDGHVHIQSNLENKSLPQAVAEFEKHFLKHWYQKYSSTRKLAQQLGVSHTTIAQKLNKYKISQ